MPPAAAALPPLPAVTAAAFRSQITSGYEVQQLDVKPGLLAHAVIHATFDVPPATVFSVLNAPHGLHVARQVLESEPGRVVAAVTMRGDFRILMKRKEFEQVIRFDLDGRNPERLVHHYEIMQSEVMHVQTGHWELTPIHGANGQVEGTAAVYELLAQARVPAVVRRLPIAKKTTHRAAMALLKSYMEDHFGMLEGIKAGLSLAEARQRQDTADSSKNHKGGKEAKVLALGPNQAVNLAMPKGGASEKAQDGKAAAAAPTTVRAFLLDDIEDDEESEGSSDTHEEGEAMAQLA